MLFEEKLKKILKSEWLYVISFITIVLVLTTCVVYFILDEYNPTKYLNLITISLVYLVILWIVVQKVMIIRKLSWIRGNYLDNIDSVFKFLRERKTKLYSCYTQKLLYLRYEEALQILEVNMKDVA